MEWKYRIPARLRTDSLVMQLVLYAAVLPDGTRQPEEGRAASAHADASRALCVNFLSRFIGLFGRSLRCLAFLGSLLERPPCLESVDRGRVFHDHAHLVAEHDCAEKREKGAEYQRAHSHDGDP